jgi:hypothetical protein
MGFVGGSLRAGEVLRGSDGGMNGRILTLQDEFRGAFEPFGEHLVKGIKTLSGEVAGPMQGDGEGLQADTELARGPLGGLGRDMQGAFPIGVQAFKTLLVRTH